MKFKTQTIAGLRLFYDVEEQEASRVIATACEKSVPLIQQRWGLPTPADCRVYVMVSWLRFLLHSAPWLWKGYLLVTLPLVARRAMSIWPHTGGWSLQYGRRSVVGIKPARLIETGNRSLGEQIFLQDREVGEVVQTVTCHELVHAFTFHLKLPAWLHEGLATLAMEHYLGRQIVREETLDELTGQFLKRTGRRRDKLQVEKPQDLISLYSGGYWLTRYIETTRPALLREMLSERKSPEELEEMLASAFGKERERFWKELDGQMLMVAEACGLKRRNVAAATFLHE